MSTKSTKSVKKNKADSQVVSKTTTNTSTKTSSKNQTKTTSQNKVLDQSLSELIKQTSLDKLDFFKKPLSQIIQTIELGDQVESEGVVLSYADGIVQAAGLDNVQSGELVDLGSGTLGLALNLENDSVGIVALSENIELKPGDFVRRTGRLLSVGVSDEILGRVVNGLGQAIDGGPAIKPAKYMPLEKIAPGVVTRESVNQPLQTGIKAIDAMIPIGRGQRELIIGDRQTGKTSIALSTILNQKQEDVVCVYVAVGQKRSSLVQFQNILEKHQAMDYTTIVAATASESAAQQFLAPYTGMAIAEYYLERGQDVLVVFDDLSKHAVAYREISLLLRRPSGREAYPGDVFYLHSRLLERACKLNPDYGGGSITALPIIETQANDVSAYIPTNVISITDGQIYLETDLFNKGMRPAINVGLSVSRVGSAAQKKVMKQVAGTMKLDLAQYRELEAFAQFSSDLDPKTKAQLDRGIRVNAILKQGWDRAMGVPQQVAVIFAATQGHLDNIEEEQITPWEKDFLDYLERQHSNLLDLIGSKEKLDDQLTKKLTEAIEQFNATWINQLNSTSQVELKDQGQDSSPQEKKDQPDQV
ncbi:MAG: F0F1 ATP synthase subunit alpha [Candidatus Pacebacteria bacterium]|nr:F0F1 ATP synthase subunit alpha [Candidatus Paceibacterota bacterium]